MREAFDGRRKYLVERLRKIPGVKCNMPSGAFYAFPDMSAYHGKKYGAKMIKDSLDLAEYILIEAQTGIVPGAAFGADKHQRFSYATSMENLQKGTERIEKALARLE